jgi:type I restriction enzyme, S subunit
VTTWLADLISEEARWRTKPLKRTAVFTEGPGVLANDFLSEGVPLLRIAGIGDRIATLEGCNYVSPETALEKWDHLRVKLGDLLISGSASTGLCAEVDDETAGSIPYTGLIIVRPIEGESIKQFLRWFFLSEKFAVQVELLKAGSGLQHFGPSHLSQMAIVPPPLDDQRTIADYLDQETARLDALIAAKEWLLGLLAEKRQALITRAVTQGLDPTCPLRDSGIPWLGRIPAHWKITLAKHVANVRGGLTLGKVYTGRALVEYPYLRVANVQDGHLDLREIATLELPATEAQPYLLRAGDVLMNEGGDADKLGRGSVWAGEIDPCLHQNHVFAVRPRAVSSEWLDAWTSSDVAKAYFESRARQSTNLASISASNIKELPLPLPPEGEQRAILEHIQRATTKLEELRALTACTIALLKERRSALIAAAVTGQITMLSESIL